MKLQSNVIVCSLTGSAERTAVASEFWCKKCRQENKWHRQDILMDLARVKCSTFLQCYSDTYQKCGVSDISTNFLAPYIKIKELI